METPLSALDIPLVTGTLRLMVEAGEWPLHELCGFAARNNRRRSFLFVSKVLGKHLPVRPRRIRGVCDALATRIMKSRLPEPILLVAMAETATGLGYGVFEGMTRGGGRGGALFVHTTRYSLLHRRVAVKFQEMHSHAPSHIIYEPEDREDASIFRNARTLVLVDDEVTTGESFLGLAREYHQLNPFLEVVQLAVLTDWLGTTRRETVLNQLPGQASIASLARGTWDFEPREGFSFAASRSDLGLGGEPKDEYLNLNHGRLGRREGPDVRPACAAAEAAVRGCGRILVLGSSEFLYAPFRVAEHLENLGHDVVYQSTTRSPILIGNEIGSRMEFTDSYHDGSPNFLYNVALGQYDRVLIGHEIRPLPEAHDLHIRLGATLLPFS